MKLFGVLIVMIGLLCGCRSTYDVDRYSGNEGMIVFVRPQNYQIFGTESAREQLEIIDARQDYLPNGNLRLTLGMRNRGHQSFFTWSQKSHEMTLYVTVDFFAGDRHVFQVPKRALVLPLGQTIYMDWLATDPAIDTAKVTFSESK